MQDDNCGREPYALRVLDDSMSPEFREGCIIIIDAEGVIVDGSYVLAHYQEEYIFRQLVFGDGVYFLQALEDGHEIIEMSDLSVIEGVIIQQAGRRRSERKHYVCLDGRP